MRTFDRRVVQPLRTERLEALRGRPRLAGSRKDLKGRAGEVKGEKVHRSSELGPHLGLGSLCPGCGLCPSAGGWLHACIPVRRGHQRATES